ncbi:hypothetical protein P1S88_17705, partial [Escherichia coli]|nr:hypothetical protein [Escherichia coli]
MRTGYIAAAILFMCLLITQNAYAADLFTVPDTDKSKLWFLDVLFPENLAQSPLASTMTILNSAILLVGGILAAYTLIAGTGNDSNLLIVFYVQIMPDDFVMQLHR